MARDAIPVVEVPTEGGTIVATAGTIVPANGGELTVNAPVDEVLLYFNNTGDPGTISIVPGANPPSLASGGTLNIAIGGTAALYVRVPGGKYRQSDGTVQIDYTSGMDGDVAAYQMYDAGVAYA